MKKDFHIFTKIGTNTMKQSKSNRADQVKSIISKIPEGRKSGFLKLICYELAHKHSINMSESGLKSFLTSGYSTVADDIIKATNTVVNRMIEEEKAFQEKIRLLKEAVELQREANRLEEEKIENQEYIYEP